MSVDVDGTRFAYREFGPDTGVPVVFLHHFTAVLDDWDPRVIDGIASERRVITFDNRGVGGTKARTPTTVSAMADDAIAFIRALGLDQVDLMGFSLGGFISQVIVTKDSTAQAGSARGTDFGFSAAGCVPIPGLMLGMVTRQLRPNERRSRLLG